MKTLLPSTSRAEAFSDGIFAILITLSMFNIKIPNLPNNTLSSFLSTLLTILPNILIFIFTYITLAILWVNHHNFFHQLEKNDWKLLWLNNNLLLWSCFLPFTTSFLGNYYTNHYVMAMYCFNMFMISFSFSILWRYVYVANPNLLSNSEDTINIPIFERKKESFRKGFLADALYIIATILALYSLSASGLMLISIQLLHAVGNKFFLPKWEN